MSAVTEYKALTRIHLPIIEKEYAPGEMISAEDLEAAGQVEEDINALVESGAIGDADAELDPSTIIPDPGMPTIALAVEEAKQLVTDLTTRGEEVPAEVQALADLDYTHATTGDTAVAGDASA